MNFSISEEKMVENYTGKLGNLWISIFSVAIGLTIISTILSAYLIYRHLEYYYVRAQQRCIVRIIVMIPIYAAISCASLWMINLNRDFSLLLAILRDGYESYALYMFFRLCIEYMGGELVMIEELLMMPKKRATFPFWCIRFQPNKKFITICRQGIVQYVIIRPLMTVIAGICFLSGKYEEGVWTVTNGYSWITVINNVCVTVAMYFLIQFYQVCSRLLREHKPLPKFMCIKMVVFFCYWQGIVIALLYYFSVIPHNVDRFSMHQFSLIVQNLLICIEMVGFAFAHLYAFPYDYYKNIEAAKGNRMSDAFDVVLGGSLLSDTFRAFFPKKWRTETMEKSILLKTAENGKQNEATSLVAPKKQVESERYDTFVPLE